MPKTLLALCYLALLGGIMGSCASRQNTQTEAEHEVWYDVLNDYYRDINDQNRIYYKTMVEPAWEQLLVYDSIFEGVHHPSSITEDSFRALVTQTDLDSIRSRIGESEREVLDPEKLTSMAITRNRDGRAIEISRPIVFKDVAVFRQLGDDAVPIFFLFKEQDKWKLRYTFYQQLNLN